MLCNTMPGKCQYPLMFSSKDYKRTEMSWKIVYIYLCEAADNIADNNTYNSVGDDTCSNAALIFVHMQLCHNHLFRKECICNFLQCCWQLAGLLDKWLVIRVFQG